MTSSATLFDTCVDPDRTSERLTARALRRSLLPVDEPHEVAAELAALAGYRRLPILGALQRIERARTARPTEVIDRSELLLCAALDLVDDAAASAA